MIKVSPHYVGCDTHTHTQRADAVVRVRQCHSRLVCVCVYGNMKLQSLRAVCNGRNVVIIVDLLVFSKTDILIQKWTVVLKQKEIKISTVASEFCHWPTQKPDMLSRPVRYGSGLGYFAAQSFGLRVDLGFDFIKCSFERNVLICNGGNIQCTYRDCIWHLKAVNGAGDNTCLIYLHMFEIIYKCCSIIITAFVHHPFGATVMFLKKGVFWNSRQKQPVKKQQSS